MAESLPILLQVITPAMAEILLQVITPAMASPAMALDYISAIFVQE
jgi:hypothetical protein